MRIILAQIVLGQTMVVGEPHRQRSERVMVVVHPKADLLEMVAALRPARGLARGLDRRQQQCDQDADNGDHDE